MVAFVRWCCVCLLGIAMLQAHASSFETQQKNTSIFDGVKGEQGELHLDATQTNYLWNSPQSLNTDAPTSGFQFRKFTGDFILTTQLQWATESKLGQGLQVESLTTNSFVLKTRLDAVGNLVVEDFREKKVALPLLARVRHPDIFQLERKDAELIFSAAAWGRPLQVVARMTLPEPMSLNVGIYRQFMPGDKSSLLMRNLRWVIPAWKNFVPYYHYLGSRLEILDVVTGERKVIYETAAGIEAPNWTSDGENIIYDSAGRVYKLHLPTKKIQLLNTGFETRTNNDHIVSYKSKTLGITHLDGGIIDNWVIYKLPITGGEPLQLTFKAPCYLHGWSPDGRYILYTSERDGKFKIYRSNSDGSGDEIQLTRGDGMDDGSEYTPDGKSIYFNSTRSGAMRLWRMDADGKNPKQITHDNFNDWFPHISPDGKQIIFLSYLPDLAPELHPYYQQVYLRLMPVGGGEPKVIAYLYGGQGTINVPSWSPDGRYVAFVSNSQLGSEKP